MNAAFTCLKDIYSERNTISGTTHRTPTFHMIGTHVIVVKLCSSQFFQLLRKCMFEFFQRPIEVNDFICNNTLLIQGARIQNFSMDFHFEE